MQEPRVDIEIWLHISKLNKHWQLKKKEKENVNDYLASFWCFPGSSAGKESACNVGDLGLIPGVGKISWRREQLPIPVFWPGEFHGLYSPGGHKELDRLSDFHFHLASLKIK